MAVAEVSKVSLVVLVVLNTAALDPNVACLGSVITPVHQVWKPLDVADLKFSPIGSDILFIKL